MYSVTNITDNEAQQILVHMWKSISFWRLLPISCHVQSWCSSNVILVSPSLPVMIFFSMNFRFFILCIFYMCYKKNYQQMRLFVLCLYFLFLISSLHVSGLHGPIIRGISSCCFYATIWFLCWTRNNTMLIVTI